MTRPRERVALLLAALRVLSGAARPAAAEEYLGRLGGSRWAPDSTANPHGVYGSRFIGRSIQSPQGRWGSRFSPEGARNPFARGGPRNVAEDGTYLGRRDANRFDSESVANR